MTRWNVQDTARLCLAAQEGQEARRSLDDPTRLGRSERRRLSAAVTAGEAAEHELLVDNRGFIAMLAERFGRQLNTAQNDQRADLMQAACIGFLRAVRTYDPGRGTKLSTLATITIREEINELTRSRHAASGKNAAKQAARVARLVEPLREHLGRDPTPDELARHFNDAATATHVAAVAGRPSNAGLSAEELWERSRQTLTHRGELVSPARVSELLRLRVEPLSLQRLTRGTRAGDPSRVELGDVLVDRSPIGRDPADVVVDTAEHQERLQAVVACMDQIVAENPQLGRMLRLRFGYEGGRPHSYADIARATGLTAPVVQRQLSRALAELRSMTDAYRAAGTRPGRGPE